MSTLSLHRRHDPFRPPEAPGLGRGMLFALAAHILLVVAISINVQWRTKTMPTAEAELWSTVPQAAAPKEVPPEPEPEPPKPTPKVQEPPQPSPAELQAQRDAEIAVAKQKEQKRKEAEHQAELEEQKRQKALKDKADKDKADKLEKQRAEDKAKADKADKDKQLKAQKADEAKREAQRQENIRRMMGMAGASGDETATGRAQKSSGPSGDYFGRVAAQIKRNIVYADNPPGNPAAEVEVKIGPTGTIIGKKLLKSSGLPEFDNAILRAIEKTEKLPVDRDGSVPPSLIISFRPKEI